MVVLCITDADQTICRSQDRYNTFRQTFLGPNRSDALPAWPKGAFLHHPMSSADSMVRDLLQEGAHICHALVWRQHLKLWLCGGI